MGRKMRYLYLEIKKTVKLLPHMLLQILLLLGLLAVVVVGAVRIGRAHV